MADFFILLLYNQTDKIGPTLVQVFPTFNLIQFLQTFSISIQWNLFSYFLVDRWWWETTTLNMSLWENIYCQQPPFPPIDYHQSFYITFSLLYWVFRLISPKSTNDCWRIFKVEHHNIFWKIVDWSFALLHDDNDLKYPVPSAENELLFHLNQMCYI